MAIDENKIIVRDNYLPDQEFKAMKSYFLGNQCYWYFCGNYGGGYPQMEHTFYGETMGVQRYPNTPMIASAGMEVMSPILKSFGFAALVRIRAICNWKTDPNVMTQRDWHVDVPFDCTTAIYYLHDSDALTLFKDDDNEPFEVETKANRLVEFPSQYEHSVSPMTTPSRRILINFNFIRAGKMQGNKTYISHELDCNQHPMT
tara:strand:+ start:856 stop:1461 length:606 start_codon:yes stop_codon:yes gene_type:complete